MIIDLEKNCTNNKNEIIFKKDKDQNVPVLASTEAKLFGA